VNIPTDKGKLSPTRPGAVWVGWTTTATREEAEHLGRGLVEEGLAACAQIDGPVTSFFRWEGVTETATEYRLTLKFTKIRAADIESWLLRHHSYQNPQWVCVRSAAAAKNYLNWVGATSS